VASTSQGHRLKDPTTEGGLREKVYERRCGLRNQDTKSDVFFRRTVASGADRTGKIVQLVPEKEIEKKRAWGVRTQQDLKAGDDTVKKIKARRIKEHEIGE